MPYFIFNGVLQCGNQSELKGEEAQHILKSRRLRIGDIFQIQDKKGRRFEVVLQNITRNSLEFVPKKNIAVPPPSPLRLEIIQALPKVKALDFILQKTTELGVDRLDIFIGIHSSKVPHASQIDLQILRWQRIALEACKQCGRQFPPEIYWHLDLKAALTALPECSRSWVLSTDSSNAISWKNLSATDEKIKVHQRLLIGPEGGLHREEHDLALSSGMSPVSLGPRILRTETAAVTAATILQFLWGDL